MLYWLSPQSPVLTQPPHFPSTPTLSVQKAWLTVGVLNQLNNSPKDLSVLGLMTVSKSWIAIAVLQVYCWVVESAREQALANHCASLNAQHAGRGFFWSINDTWVVLKVGSHLF